MFPNIGVGGILVLLLPASVPAVEPSLGEALNATHLNWSTSGDALWFSQTNVTHDGVAAAQAGAVTNSQTTMLETSVEGPGTLTFWVRMESETYQAGRMGLYDHGALLDDIYDYNARDWVRLTFYLGEGNHLLRWQYENHFQRVINRAWLDEVAFSPGHILPAITTQPVSQSKVPGLDVTFQAEAVGTPPLSYQWRLNGADILGATNDVLQKIHLTEPEFGDYTLAVSNVAGVTLTDIATLERGIIGSWAKGDVWDYAMANVPLGLTNLLMVAAGRSHALALKSGGTVYAWGRDFSGQASIPDGLSNVISVAAGTYGSLALKSDGTVVGWGDQLGLIPADATNVVSIAAGHDGGIALRADGSVIGWGTLATPTPLTNMVAIAAGHAHGLALAEDGRVVGWGWNAYGQTKVPGGLSNVIALAAGDYYSLALQDDGRVIDWGTSGPGPLPPSSSKIIDIDAKDHAMIALRADGTMAAGSPDLTNVMAMTTGGGFGLAIVGEHPPMIRDSLSEPSMRSDGFRVSLPSECGRVYRLEYKSSIDDASWIPLPMVAGTGRELVLEDPNAIGHSTRFYRVRRL